MKNNPKISRVFDKLNRYCLVDVTNYTRFVYFVMPNTKILLWCI